MIATFIFCLQAIIPVVYIVIDSVFSYYSPFTINVCALHLFAFIVCLYCLFNLFCVLQDSIKSTFLFLDTPSWSFLCSALFWIVFYPAFSFFLSFLFLFVGSVSFWISLSHFLFSYSIFSGNCLWEGVLEVKFSSSCISEKCLQRTWQFARV